MRHCVNIHNDTAVLRLAGPERAWIRLDSIARTPRGPEFALPDCGCGLSRFNPYGCFPTRLELNHTALCNRTSHLINTSMHESKAQSRSVLKKGASAADVHDFTPAGFLSSVVAGGKFNRKADGLTAPAWLSALLARPCGPVSRIGTSGFAPNGPSGVTSSSRTTGWARAFALKEKLLRSSSLFGLY